MKYDIWQHIIYVYMSVYWTIETWGIQPIASNCFCKVFSVSKIEKCKDVIFLCIFCIFLCIIKWLGATLKTYFYQKNQIKYCSRDQDTNKSQPPKKIYDKRCFLNMSTGHASGCWRAIQQKNKKGIKFKLLRYRNTSFKFSD